MLRLPLTVAGRSNHVRHRERNVRLFRDGRNQALRSARELELEGDDAVIRIEGERPTGSRSERDVC